MISQRKREAAPVEETAAVFYDVTRRLLLDARWKRDQALLRRCALRIDGARFSSLSEARQDELLGMYSEAMAACGVMSP